MGLLCWYRFCFFKYIFRPSHLFLLNLISIIRIHVSRSTPYDNEGKNIHFRFCSLGFVIVFNETMLFKHNKGCFDKIMRKKLRRKNDYNYIFDGSAFIPFNVLTAFTTVVFSIGLNTVELNIKRTCGFRNVRRKREIVLFQRLQNVVNESNLVVGTFREGDTPQKAQRIYRGLHWNNFIRSWCIIYPYNCRGVGTINARLDAVVQTKSFCMYCEYNNQTFLRRWH